MSFTVEWGKDDSRAGGHGIAAVSKLSELDTVLDDIEARAVEAGKLFVVHIYASEDDDGLPGGVQIGVGHPQRSFAYWLGDEGGTAFEPDVPPGPADLRFDYGGQPILPTPGELRLRPATARQIVRDYLQTPTRSSSVSWYEEHGSGSSQE
jgi:hypothetical protein